MFRDYLRYAAFCGILGLCHLLPARLLYWVAIRLADLNYLFDRRGREAVKANLRVVLPDAPEERITYEARWVFRNFGKYLSEFFRLRTFDKAFFQKHAMIRGKEYVDEALARGKGVILLSAHLSNWEFGAAAIKMLYEHEAVNVVVAMHRYGRVNNLFMRERESMGLKVIDMRNAPRQGLRALRNGEIVCILGDRDPTEQGVAVEFFQKPCRFPQGPARFAIATGAAVVPVFVLRRTNDSFTIVFGPPIDAPQSSAPGAAGRDERARALTQRFAAVIEEAIRWHPEEWGVFYRVWEDTWRE